MLSLFTLCLRVCSNICGTGGVDRRCCVLHCAVSIHCCCEWKAGRLRIIPDSPEVAGRADHHAQAAGGVVGSPATRRATLYPPPPPAYLELFPSNGENVSSAPTVLASEAANGHGETSSSTQDVPQHQRSGSINADAVSTLSTNTTIGTQKSICRKHSAYITNYRHQRKRNVRKKSLRNQSGHHRQQQRRVSCSQPIGVTSISKQSAVKRLGWAYREWTRGNGWDLSELP